MKGLRDRFNAKTRPAGDCLLWTGNTRDGYGQMRIGGRAGRTVTATHVALFLRNGDWPEGIVCHTCDTPACVNADHLFVGTHRDNHQDKARKGRAGKSLNADLVREIRALAGIETQDQIAERFGVSRRTIGNVIRRNTWKDL